MFNGKKNVIKVTLQPDIIQIMDYYALATGTDRSQIVNIAILQFFGKGSPDASASKVFENIDFSALETFVKDYAEGANPAMG